MSKLTSECLLRFPSPLKLGEGPIYRFEDHTLHFIDFQSKQVHIVPIDPETCTVDKTRKHVVHDAEEPVTCLYFQAHKPEYICLYFGGIGEFNEVTGSFKNLKTICPDLNIRRMNDGAVDPKGRFWVGELDIKASQGPLGCPEKAIGRLWRYDPDGSIHLMIPGGLAISNGIGFSPDHKKMYLNDSMGQLTYAFDFDLENGTISNRTIVHDFRGTKEEPDGMVVDVEGNIWSALYNGYGVVCISTKTGEILERVHIPAQAVTCPTWGGANNDTLFLTTGSANGTEHDGHIYKIKTNTKGMPNYKFGQ